jgi:hypothetical protein
VTASFARDLLTALPGARAAPADADIALEAWAERTDATLGPASSVRSITDARIIPLLRILGYAVAGRIDNESSCLLRIVGTAAAPMAVHIVGWGMPLEPAWRIAVLDSVAADGRWTFCSNGTCLRIVDGQRTWSRDYLEFDLATIAADHGMRTVLWSLASAVAMAASPPLLDAAATLSARHGVEVCRALGAGVLESLRLLLGARQHGREPPPVVFEQSLTVLYRVLFLLFAEARGLVPMWHPVYRDRYSLEVIVSTLLSGSGYRGLWHAVQAISRLAHGGHSTSGLRVTAFNGRLFAPSQTPSFDRTAIDDGVMASVILALGSTAIDRRGRRAKIAYRDLDVEQLGAVYEQVLDYEPGRRDASTLERTGDTRKASGTYYTPRTVTAALVRQTLEPLVRGRTSDAILSLRVLDPAMGSGAFLVGACRYLASAMEAALVREGRWHSHDITPADRAGLRRTIAARCLFGVDQNATAVQLARLSLWLVTLAADKPLSFLDHHLVAGDSLIGASPGDLQRQPSRAVSRRTVRRGAVSRGSRQKPLTLFEIDGLAPVLENAARTRSGLASRPDDSAADVRAKEQELTSLDARGGPLGRWRRALDLWCAGWFMDDDAVPDRGAFHALVDHALHGRSALADRVAAPLLAAADATAAEHRFLHWELAFPEVFVDASGQRLAGAGFDAVLGNPPWDMVRGDSGDDTARTRRRRDARRLTTFVREAGIYRVETRAHVNRYQLFVERALQLVRQGGRLGLVLPSGVLSDAGTAPLRRFLFDRADVDTVIGVDNREAIFPIHRSVRFVLLAATAGSATATTRCRFGVSRAGDLERGAGAIVLSRDLLARLSGGDDLGVPELGSARDLAIVERIAASVPRLGASAGWHASFGRELNATDDRGLFVPASGHRQARPVVEGKQLEPFRVALDRCRLEVPPRLTPALAVPRRPRLAYRDVASAGNRLTLIAAIVPGRAVTTHTLFCLKTPLRADAQQVLCAMLNSFVANYLVRMRVSTHVTVSLMSRLPVPFLTGGAVFDRLHKLAQTLQGASAPTETMPEYAELQARAAVLYGLSPAEFEHVLGTFPLIPLAVRAAAFKEFTRFRS